MTLTLGGADPAAQGGAMAAAVAPLSAQARMAGLSGEIANLEIRAPKKAISLALEGIALAKQEGDKEKEAAFLASAAYCYSQTGDLLLSLRLGKEALDLATRIHNRERIAKAHSTLGMTYMYSGSYSQSLEENLEALRIREEMGFEDQAIQSLNNIGALYHNSGQFEKAIEYYQMILDRIASRQEPARVILTNLNLGFALNRQGKFSEALKRHEDALALIRQSGIDTRLAYAYQNLGLDYTGLREFHRAERFLNLALAEYGRQEQKHGQVQVLNALGRLYLVTGAHARAIALGREAVALSEQISARDETKAAYQLLADIHAKLGDVAQSYHYFKLFTATKDSIFTVQESNKIADVSMRIVSLKKDNEIEALKRERVISSLNLEKGRYRSIFLISSLGFMVTIVLVLGQYTIKVRNNKQSLKLKNLELERLNADLQDKITEIKTLSGLLPICAQCKKIRNDSGYWEQLEGYISEHTSATFSHGICPHCAEQLYPEAMQGIRDKQLRESQGG